MDRTYARTKFRNAWYDDKSASSINTDNIQYEHWKKEGNKLILTARTMAMEDNVTTVSDTLHIKKSSADSLVLTKGKQVWRYAKTNSTDMIKHDAKPETKDTMVITGSLHMQDNQGKVVERIYEGSLPAASSPAIKYTVSMYNQLYGGEGVYKMVTDYAGANNGKDEVSTNYGRFTIQVGENDARNATIYHLQSFDKTEHYYFLLGEKQIKMLDQQGDSIKSEHNYTLKLISEI